MKQKILQITLLLGSSTALSILIASFSSTFANFVWKTFYPIEGVEAYYTLFYSYPILIGLLFTFLDPKKYGLFPENTFKEWRTCLIWILIVVIPILTYLNNVSSTPFKGLTWQVFVLAPLGEEIIFRGALYTWIYEVVKDIFEKDNPNNILEQIKKSRKPLIKRGGIREKIIDIKSFKEFIFSKDEEDFNDNNGVYVVITIIFSALAFGFWHIPNIFINAPYAVSQISYTIILGLIFGYLRFKTKSIYICIFIHSIVNFLATVA